MPDPKAQPPGAGASALEARIVRVRQNMAMQQARLARSTMLTAAVGAILCIAMAVWFYLGFTMLRDFSTPRTLVDAAEGIVLKSLPNARATLTSKINESADEWAEDVSKQVQTNIPEVRRKLEELIVEQAGMAIDEFQVLSASEFRKFVQTNQPMLSDGFRSLKKQDEADRFVQDLHSAVEEQLGGDMRSQSEDMLHILFDLNAKLDALAKGERLNHEQALEQEILMIARRLQLDTQSAEPEDPETAAAKRRARKARLAETATSVVTDPTTEQAATTTGDSAKE